MPYFIKMFAGVIFQSSSGDIFGEDNHSKISVMGRGVSKEDRTGRRHPAPFLLSTLRNSHVLSLYSMPWASVSFEVSVSFIFSMYKQNCNIWTCSLQILLPAINVNTLSSWIKEKEAQFQCQGQANFLTRT